MAKGFLQYAKEIINDALSSSNTTYSSSKIDSLLQNANGKLISTSKKLTQLIVGQTQTLNYTDLLPNINDLHENQIVYDDQEILGKINSIDKTTGQVVVETIHSNDKSASSIPEPADDGKLYFRTRTPGNTIGQWSLFNKVDGTTTSITMNTKNSRTEGTYIPKAGELVYDTARDIIVLGDGTTNLTTLRAFYQNTLTNNDIIAALGYTPENIANKGQANGYAPLGSDGRVPDAFLPASATDVYSKAEVDQKDTAIKNALTTLINAEASTARANEKTLTTDLTNHINDNVRHITQAERDAWNAKVDKTDLTDFTNHIKDTSIHVTQADKDKWNGMNKAYFVQNVSDLPTKDNQIGNIGYVQVSAPGVTPIACESYIWDGTAWQQLDKDQISMTFNWGNIVGRPTSSALAIDNTVKAAHNHTNKLVLDKISQSTTGNFMYDGKEIGISAVFVDSERDLDVTGKEDTLYVVYSDSRVRGYPSISVWRDGAYQILGRGTQDAPTTVGDLSILQSEYFSVEAGKSFIIEVKSNQFFAFLPVEILKEIDGPKDAEKVITDFTEATDFKYKSQLLDISKSNHLRIKLAEIPTNLDKIEDTYFSSVEIDLTDYKDISGIQ